MNISIKKREGTSCNTSHSTTIACSQSCPRTELKQRKKIEKKTKERNSAGNKGKQQESSPQCFLLVHANQTSNTKWQTKDV